MLVIKDQCALCTLYTGASLLLRWHAKDPKDHGRLCTRVTSLERLSVAEFSGE